MRLINILWVLLLTIGCTTETQQPTVEEKSHLQEDRLVGLVKQNKVMAYEAIDEFGEVSKGKLQEMLVTNYDREGNRREFRGYNSDGELNVRWEYNYDENGRLFEEIKYEVV